MKRSSLRFRFSARLERMPSATGVTQIAPVPDEMAAAWKTAGVRRLVGTLNGHHVKRALQNHADGGSFIMLGRPLLKEIGAAPRANVHFELWPDPAPDVLDVPAEFAEVLAQDAGARDRWETFTVGLQRSLLIYVSSAKREETRLRRALELATKIRERGLHFDLAKQGRAGVAPPTRMQPSEDPAGLGSG